MDNHGRDHATKFMEKAAQAYSSQVPSLTAEMMLHRSMRAANSHLQVPDKACEGCGTIQVWGTTSKKSLEHSSTAQPKSSSSRRRDRRAKSGSNEPEAKFVKVECLACHRYQKLSQGECSAKFSKQGVNKPSLAAVSQAGSSHPEKQQAPSSANRSSKERAKMRKQTALQMMLERSKQSSQAPSGPELDLMDLMIGN